MIQAAIIAAVFAADRATKVWARGFLAPRPSIPVLPFFHLTYVENTGAAFGMLQGGNAFFICVAVALLAGLFVLRQRWSREDRWFHWALALVAGGALGNLYDRILFGHVVDFLDFRVWPVFNVADSCISVGAACLALLMGREDGRSGA